MNKLTAEETEIEMDKFEAWFVTHRTDWSKDCMHRIPYKNGLGFASGYMQAMWTAWKARAALEQQPTTDTYRQIENDGWIEWRGGECPVAAMESVDIKQSDGFQSQGRASQYYWIRQYLPCDIIAYRVIENDGREE